jgi:Tfp pilus assembly protein PilV
MIKLLIGGVMAKDKGKKEKKKPKKLKIKQEGFALLEGLLILVIVSVVGFAGWYVVSSKNSANNSYDKASSVDTAAAAKKSASSSQQASTSGETANPISAALKENTAASISSDNTAALEGYMTSSVTVVIAASEKGGSESAVQAIKDLDYLSSATDPWDFNLDAATLTSYKNGFYGQYFGTNVIVGKSADGHVVAFGVNNAGKIDTVFMASNASLLTQ